MQLLDTNLIQIRLIKESQTDPFNWIQKYGKKFRIIINGGVVSIDDIKVLLYDY